MNIGTGGGKRTWWKAALLCATVAWTQAAPAQGLLNMLGGGSKTKTGGNTLLAESTDPVLNGPTQTGQLCMQRAYGTPVTNANRLNCTANDISIAEAVSVFPDKCVVGERKPLIATFKVNVTANARYDATFFFRTDGGANARGEGAMAAGICSLSSLTPTVPEALDLDGDSCGDLNSGTYMMTFEIPDVLCEDDDGDGFLNLPNCTSWHSNAGTACTSDAEATNFLSSHKPETKSKCKCDDNFNVPVRVQPPGISVEKTASPTSAPETGTQVTFNVLITNTATLASAAIDTLSDTTPYKNLGTKDLLTIPLCTQGQPNAAFVGPCTPTTQGTTSCPSLANQMLAPGGIAECQFSLFIAGNAGASITDTVRACATGNSQQACAQEDATVVISDVAVEPTVEKTATATACTVDASYMVSVTNNSTTDAITVNSLSDDKFGNIATPHAAGGGFEEVVSTECDTDLLGRNIPVGESATCSFVGRIVSPSCSIDHTNTVTATATDDDGEEFSPDDTATVRVVTTRP